MPNVSKSEREHFEIHQRVPMHQASKRAYSRKQIEAISQAKTHALPGVYRKIIVVHT